MVKYIFSPLLQYIFNVEKNIFNVEKNIFNVEKNIFNPALKYIQSITNILYLHGNNSLEEHEAGSDGG